MTPTRSDREAFAREYWPDGVARGTSGDVWIETGRGGNPAWDAGARAVARARSASYSMGYVEGRYEARSELPRLAAQVAIKVGEHEYARGVRDGLAVSDFSDVAHTLEDLLRLGVES